jgi:glycosyltransferase involved in cell wall biosynthesis
MVDGERPVKIVRVIARLNTGGPAMHTIFLSERLGARGFASTLVTGVVSPGEGDMIPMAAERGVTPIVIPELQRDPMLVNDLRALVKICRILFRVQPDIIHTHTAKAGLLGRLAAWVYNAVCRVRGRRRAVVLHTFHGHLFKGYFPGALSRLLVLGERLLARITDRIVTVSAQLREELIRRYRIGSEAKCVVVPVGLDFSWTRSLPERRGTLRRQAGVDPACLTVGIVGRLTAIKNHEVFLRAASACRRPDVRFFVIGDGERAAELRELARRLGVDGRLVFTGWQDDRAAVYGGLDITCLTSRNEGTPLALIETMAAGKTFVATKVGGVPDLMVGEGSLREGFEVFANGILIPPDREELLLAAVEFLAGRPEMRQAMGACGQAFALEKFSIERLLSEMDALYSTLLGRPGGQDSIGC